MGGRKLVGAVRVVGLVTKKSLGKTLAPPTKGVGGYWHVFVCPSFPNRVLSPSCIYFRCGAHACTISAPLKVARFTAQKLLAKGCEFLEFTIVIGHVLFRVSGLALSCYASGLGRLCL